MAIGYDLYPAIYSKLTGSTALTALLSGTTAVYDKQAPIGAALPYVVYSIAAGGPDNICPSPLENVVVSVRAWAETGKQARAIDQQIDNLLRGTKLTMTNGWVNFWSAREQDIEMVETSTSNQVRYMAGGLYRFRFDK